MTVIVTSMDDHDRSIGPLGPVRDQLDGKISVLVGHSGVGKSTLVNALVPDSTRATGHVNDVTGRGRHTSTSAVALRLPDGAGWVVDTPGIRSFGLAHVEPDRVLAAFDDLADVSVDCPGDAPTPSRRSTARSTPGWTPPHRTKGRIGPCVSPRSAASWRLAPLRCEACPRTTTTSASPM